MTNQFVSVSRDIFRRKIGGVEAESRLGPFPTSHLYQNSGSYVPSKVTDSLKEILHHAALEIEHNQPTPAFPFNDMAFPVPAHTVALCCTLQSRLQTATSSFTKRAARGAQPAAPERRHE
jgi:hypothetical protein